MTRISAKVEYGSAAWEVYQHASTVKSTHHPLPADPLPAVIRELKAVQASRGGELGKLIQERAIADAEARRIIADVKAGHL